MIFENELEKEMMDATLGYLENKKLDLLGKSEDFELLMFFMSISNPDRWGRAWINYCKNDQGGKVDGRK
jgi:hypothetical protein